jgi:hypothetical protein
MALRRASGILLYVQANGKLQDEVVPPVYVNGGSVAALHVAPTKQLISGSPALPENIFISHDRAPSGAILKFIICDH